jgi:hypothetical protein
MRSDLILAAAAVAALAGLYGLGRMHGAEVAEARHAAALSAALAEVRQTERDLVRAVDKVAGDAYAREQEAETADDDAGAAVRRLRAEIASRDAAARDTLAAAQSDATAARALLADCAERHRGLARDADRIRRQLITLQDYVRGVCLRPQPSAKQ